MDEPHRTEPEQPPQTCETGGKRPYEKPRLRCVGDVVSLTHGGHSGVFDGHGGRRTQ